MKFNSLKSFTLAEVLITLGIIGIVAAMTLPAVTAHYRKNVTISRLKGFYSLINQAVTLSEVTNESSKYWDVPDMSNPVAAEEWYKKYLDKYIMSTSISRRVGDYTVWVRFVNGSAFGIRYTSMEEGSASFDVYFYPNPKSDMETKAANLEWAKYHCGSDFFTFNYVPGQGFVPYGGFATGDRESLVKACKDNANRCTRLIMYDGWEIKKDYPYRI